MRPGRFPQLTAGCCRAPICQQPYNGSLGRRYIRMSALHSEPGVAHPDKTSSISEHAYLLIRHPPFDSNLLCCPMIGFSRCRKRERRGRCRQSAAAHGSAGPATGPRATSQHHLEVCISPNESPLLRQGFSEQDETIADVLAIPVYDAELIADPVGGVETTIRLPNAFVKHCTAL
jgi:hypothetical protein